MPEKLLQHKHCVSCGKAVPASQDFCSEECTEKHRAVISKKRRQLLILWIGAMAVIVLAFFLTQ